MPYSIYLDIVCVQQNYLLFCCRMWSNARVATQPPPQTTTHATLSTCRIRWKVCSSFCSGKADSVNYHVLVSP